MSKLLAAIVAAMFVVVTTGSFAASHVGAQPMKDAPKVDCKDPKHKDDKACKSEAKKDEMKK
jgi:Spy/CpxP family protein refolding chaperone